MPIYEFRCEECGTEFEKFVISPFQVSGIKCPNCGSEDVEVIDITNYCSPFG